MTYSLWRNGEVLGHIVLPLPTKSADLIAGVLRPTDAFADMGRVFQVRIDSLPGAPVLQGSVFERSPVPLEALTPEAAIGTTLTRRRSARPRSSDAASSAPASEPAAGERTSVSSRKRVALRLWPPIDVAPVWQHRIPYFAAIRPFQLEARTLDRDRSLRDHVSRLLDWEDAHAGFDTAVQGIAPEFRGAVPDELPYSIWQLLEHMRHAQHDILEFCRNPNYVEAAPEDMWPLSASPPTPEAWDESIAAFLRDRAALKQLAEDGAIDLFQRIPHGTGQTCLRELLLAADHNAYHVAQIVVLRRLLGIWEGG